MSKKTDKDAIKSQVEEENTEIVEDEEADSSWYYFYSQGCGWCKKSEPVVDELNKEGHDILKLDLADKDNQALAAELKQEYNIQCGTPWFINEATGESICGFREKDVIEKWLNGEKIPVPPRPKGPIPKLPLLEAPKAELDKWKKEYKKWLKENDHLPDNQIKSMEDMLAMPRPKTDPPKPPNANMSDDELTAWGVEFDAWAKVNSHLPNLQPASTIIQRIKGQSAQKQQPQNNNVDSKPVDSGKLNTIDAKIQALEVKVDKIIKHFGI